MKKSIFVIAAAAAVGFASMASAATISNPVAPLGFGYSNLGTGGGASPTNYTASGDGSGASVQAIANGWEALLGGTLTFTRIFDSGSSTYNDIGSSAISSAVDRLWHDGTVNVGLRATFAGDNQWIGTQTSAGLTTQTEPPLSGVQLSSNKKFINVKQGFSTIAASNPYPFELKTGLPNTSDGSSGTFSFVRSSGGATVDQSSNPTANAGGKDQMIAFKVTQTQGSVSTDYYAIFFEDRSSGDFDYNDMAVLFRGTSGGPIIPLPSAAGMGLALLGGLGLSRVRRQMI